MRFGNVGFALAVTLNDHQFAPMDGHRPRCGVVEPHHEADLCLFDIRLHGAGFVQDQADTNVLRLGESGASEGQGNKGCDKLIFHPAGFLRVNQAALWGVPNTGN